MIKFRSFTVLCLLACAASGVHGQDLSREALVRDAVARFEAERANGEAKPQAPRITPSPSARLRDLRLDEAVELALAQNLDIAVERLSPQVTDFQIAGLRGAYRPVASSSLGQRSQVNPPTNQLNGGQRVANDTTTYNFGVAKIVPWGGGNFLLNFNNSRLGTNNLFANYNPNYTSTLTATYNQPLLRGFRIDGVRQQIAVTLVNREIAEESLRGDHRGHRRQRPQCLLGPGLRPRRRQRRPAIARARRQAGRGQPGPGRGRHAGPDRRGPGRGRGRHPAPDPGPGRSHAGHRAAGAQALARQRHQRPAVGRGAARRRRADARLDGLDRHRIGAVRRALDRRTDLATARKNLDSNDITLRYWRNESRPALDLQVNYGAQGIGGTQFIRDGTGIGSNVTGTIPGGYADALSLLGAARLPDLERRASPSATRSAAPPPTPSMARTRVLRNQQSTRLRALELTVAAEVTNAALQVEANRRRVDAARAARELAERRLEAEQSKFEVGLSTNFFVVQAQRDLADAENVELRALTDMQKSQVTFERAQESPANATSGGGQQTVGQNAGTTGTGGGQD